MGRITSRGREIYKTEIYRLRLLRLSESQSHRCCYCGRDTWHPDIEDYDTVKHTKRNRATLEHVNTLLNGGTWSKFNLAMACDECNNVRGEKPMRFFVALVTSNCDIPMSKKILKKQARYLRNGKTYKLGKNIIAIRNRIIENQMAYA